MKKKSKFLSEFKQFISRGNVMDMAVGIIMGSAFTNIVNSLVNDLIMPAVGMLLGGLSFSDLKIVLSPAAGDVAEVALYYGNFIQKTVDFLIIALAVFCMIKVLNRLHRKKEAEAAAEAPAPVDPQVELLAEIRDLLKK